MIIKFIAAIDSAKLSKATATSVTNVIGSKVWITGQVPFVLRSLPALNATCPRRHVHHRILCQWLDQLWFTVVSEVFWYTSEINIGFTKIQEPVTSAPLQHDRRRVCLTGEVWWLGISLLSIFCFFLFFFNFYFGGGSSLSLYKLDALVCR